MGLYHHSAATGQVFIVFAPEYTSRLPVGNTAGKSSHRTRMTGTVAAFYGSGQINIVDMNY